MIIKGTMLTGYEGESGGGEKNYGASPPLPVLPPGTSRQPNQLENQGDKVVFETRGNEPLGSTPPLAGSSGAGELLIPLASLGEGLPDPARPFWWFSTGRVSKRVRAGCPVMAKPGSRIPPEADYWCHEGDAEWARVDRVPEPPAKKSKGKLKRRTARVLT